jgi:hypothetical protein
VGPATGSGGHCRGRAHRSGWRILTGTTICTFRRRPLAPQRSSATATRSARPRWSPEPVQIAHCCGQHAMRPALDRNACRMRDLAAVAAEQHGVVSLAQLTTLDVSPDEVRRRVRRGEWRRVRTGVVALTRPPTQLEGLAQAVWAVLVLLPSGSVACGPTAADLWRLERAVRTATDRMVHVLLPAGVRHHPLRGCRLHQGRNGETATVFGVPSTGLARTCVEEARGCR